jgi:putative NADPH-quinone reductase
MNVLVINGHPREDSFCSAISMAYIAGAKTAQAEIRYLPLAERPFNLNVTHSSPKQQVEEPVIQNARELILWATTSFSFIPPGGEPCRHY